MKIIDDKPWTIRRSPAAVLLALLLDPALLQVDGARIVLVKLGEHGAGIGLAAEHRQSDAELQQVVGSLGARLVDLVAVGEGSHGVLIITTRIISLAQPVLRVARQHMLGIALQECLKAPLRVGVVAVVQLLEGVVVHLVRPSGG